MPTNYNNIPDELKALGAVFCLGDTNKNPVGKGNKGNRRKWSDPSIYYTFDEALKARSKYCPYIGIITSPKYAPAVSAAGFCFIDLDGKGHDADGATPEIIEEWDRDLQRVKQGDFSHAGKFSDIIKAADTYAEISVSGTGVHIIYKGNKKINVNEKGNIENDNKFLVLTGCTIEQYKEINVIQDITALDNAAKRYALKAPELPRVQSPSPPPPTFDRSPSDSDRGRPDLDRINAHGESYVNHHFTPSPKAGTDMYNCPMCGSGTKKNGTGALHIPLKDGHIVFDCHSCHRKGDFVQLEYTYTHSGAVLPSFKEDRRTYLEYAKELSNKLGEPLISSAAVDFKEPIDDTELDGYKDQIIVTAPPPEIKPIYDYLPAISAYLSDSERRRPFKTGFSDLDEALGGGLYPEQVTLIGAVPSLGKTTLVLQIADYVARSGKPVVYFALEMSQAELVARSVSRISYEHDPGNALTQLDVMNCFNKPEKIGQVKYNNMRGAAAEYKQDISRKLYIIERRETTQANADKRLSVFDIQDMTKRILKQEGQKPLVIIDYFQIMRPHTTTAQEYDVLKCAATTLKELARETQTHILVISSFNRSNYDTIANYAAFKGTGELEYSADNVIGMQAAGIGGQNFDINEAKRKDPRNIELVLLKTRSTKTGESYKVNYYPAFNYFECDGIKTENEYSTDSINRRLQRNADNWNSRLDTLTGAFEFCKTGNAADFDEIKKFLRVTAPTLKSWLKDFDEQFAYDPKTKKISVIKKRDDRPEDVKATEESIKALIKPE